MCESENQQNFQNPDTTGNQAAGLLVTLEWMTLSATLALENQKNGTWNFELPLRTRDEETSEMGNLYDKQAAK